MKPTMNPTDKRALLLRASRLRRLARGVALVEGAVIFPVMSIFLVLLEVSHHSYDGYLYAEHVAEERTWSGATMGAWSGCPTGRDDTSTRPKYVTMDGATGTPSNQGSTGQISTGGSGATVPGGPTGFFLFSAGATATVEVKRGGRDITHSPKAKSEVFCNQPWHGSILDMIESAFSSKKGG